MVKHIVLFKLKDNISLEEKLTVMKQFKKAIENLPSEISFIRKIEVGFNVNSSEVWDIVLNSEFDSLDDVKAYAIHPAHLAAGKILAGVKENRACVDYEV
ncbi:Dabb family protein [uncultured Bacteroides sp.]|uniref:Dabb family protein n=1 Tax=uncultured Bacteroides sp. TaxID=162156 RepID=UPI002AAC2EED|nr:Dabb family protein [uncultured Bacteroides sp.]